MLYLQTVLDIQPPPLEELLPYLWLVCYAEGYQMDPADLVCLTALIGRDVRQLLQTLELYRGVPHPFESYLSISPQMSMIGLKSRSIPSKIAVDTYRLVQCFESVVHHNEDEDMAESSQESLEDILGTLNNDGFIDVWTGSRERRLLVSFLRYTLINLIPKKVQTSTDDSIIGYTHLVIDEEESVLNDIQIHATVLNHLSNNTEFNESLWDELEDARQRTYEVDVEAIEKILPLRMMYRHDVIMTEYIPAIRLMLDPVRTGVLDSRSRQTRSKRKRIHLPLDDDSVNILTEPKELVDEVRKNTFP